jgi:hypothetical protein
MPDAQNWLLTRFFLLTLHELATSSSIVHIFKVSETTGFLSLKTNKHLFRRMLQETEICANIIKMKGCRGWRNKKEKRNQIKGTPVWDLNLWDSTVCVVYAYYLLPNALYSVYAYKAQNIWPFFVVHCAYANNLLLHAQCTVRLCFCCRILS